MNVHIPGVNFARERWDYIVNELDGKLPLEIKAAPEGSVIPVNNVLFTIQNTVPGFGWLVGHVETVLTHVWQGSTVATQSRETKLMLEDYLEKTCDDGKDYALLDYMLHDFGYRGVSSVESAAWGGMGHLVNFKGTDTIIAIEAAQEFYGADCVASSVKATEHSINSARGREGEVETIIDIITKCPTGVLSMVSDTYDIFNCVENIYGEGEVKEMILARDGVFVIRPDSLDPVTTMKRLLEITGRKFGYTVNDKGYKVLNPKIGLIWGDGINHDGVKSILDMMVNDGWSVQNVVYGMGGCLLQKINRDTQRFAFKASCHYRNGEWFDIFKDPICEDPNETKKSKAGRFKLVKSNGEYRTIDIDADGDDIMEYIYRDGEMVKEYTFDEVRENSTK